MPEKRQSASAWPWESGKWRVAKAAKQKIDGSCGACREVDGGANTERRAGGARSQGRRNTAAMRHRPNHLP